MSVKQNIIEPLALLPHARELQNYLITLATSITGKKKPPADYVHDLKSHSGIFVDLTDINRIVDNIRTLYKTEGYRKPWDLENDLIRQAQPDLPKDAISYADKYAAIDLAPDPLTGYYQKTQIPLTMALAALYTQSTGNPVSIIEIDWSNMRGTNEHFASLLSAAEGVGLSGFVQQEAMSLTDHAAYITASAMRNTIAESLKDRNSLVTPIRTGGDEARFILPNVKIEEARNLIEKMHASVENVTAIMNLHDHPHSKRPLDEFSNGFGACAAAFELKVDGQHSYDNAIFMADKEIQKSKEELGRKRISNPEFDKLKPTGPTYPACYKNCTVADAHLTTLLQRMAILREALATEDGPTAKIPSLEDVAKKMSPDHFLTLEQIQEEFYSHLKSDLAQSGVVLSPEQERLLQIKVNRFPAIDHSTGTLMARDLPAMAGVALEITDSLNHRANLNQPLWTCGASFHNLAGLNEALGHEAANAVLHTQAHDIFEASLFRAGIARENFYLAHMGGGEFRAVIQPIIIDQDGSARLIDQKTMDLVCTTIKEKTKLLNKNYAHIENPRAEMRPWENGIIVTVEAKAYEIDKRLDTNESRRGGAIVSFIGEYLTDEIQNRRMGYSHHQPIKQKPAQDMP